MKTANPTKTCVRNISRTRNCRRKFIKNLLPEKPKENINHDLTIFAICDNLKQSSD